MCALRSWLCRVLSLLPTPLTSVNLPVLAGVRMPQAPLGGGGMTNDQLAQLAQLGLLGKQAPAPAPPSMSISAQHQAALLNALQVGSGSSAAVLLSTLPYGFLWEQLCSSKG